MTDEAKSNKKSSIFPKNCVAMIVLSRIDINDGN